ncbi:MAG: flagellar biosynthesis anti-sigma factor FlgM [Burkholderiaceae bacterium]
MKINNSIDSIKTDPLTATPARQGSVVDKPPAGGPDANERVDISSASRALVDGDSKDFRADKVAEVRQAIEEGRFAIHVQKVADKMISEAAELLETIAKRPGSSKS